MGFFGPKKADHQSVGKPCPVCSIPFKEGDMTGLVAIKPADEENAAKAAAGRPYTAEAVEVHEHCMEAVAHTYVDHMRDPKCQGLSGKDNDEMTEDHETSKTPMTPVENTVDIGRSIKFVRVAAGIRQGEMAKRLSISQNYLSLLENNRAEPSLSLLRRISTEFHVPVNFLLGNRCVHNGIHVYNDRERAEETASNFWDYNRVMKVIPVYVNADDFIAAGRGESVFMKVRINKKDLKA